MLTSLGRHRWWSEPGHRQFQIWMSEARCVLILVIMLSDLKNWTKKWGHIIVLLGQRNCLITVPSGKLSWRVNQTHEGFCGLDLQRLWRWWWWQGWWRWWWGFLKIIGGWRIRWDCQSMASLHILIQCFLPGHNRHHYHHIIISKFN